MASIKVKFRPFYLFNATLNYFRGMEDVNIFA